MSEHKQLNEILSLIVEPAFSVCAGTITHCNDAAQRMMLPTGVPISSLLSQDHQKYDIFEDSCLFLTLKHNGLDYSAVVMRIHDADVFVLDEESNRVELRTLSLTAVNMRQPLSSMIATTNALTSALAQSNDPKTQEQLRHMNRSLCQMHRMLCNMSDALQYADGNSNHMICQNVVSVVEGIFHQAQLLCEQSGVQMEYSVPNDTILCSIDEQLLERGIYNLISNAIKFSKQGSSVQASLLRRENRVFISVRDHGDGIPPSVLGSVFHRYQRQPGLEDSRYGLGLGLALVRSAARVHGGTVLVDRPGNIGTRVTISFPIRQSSAPLLRSNIIRVDYAGGWDHGLLELSEVLPTNLY